MEKLGLVGSQGFRCYQYNIDSDDSPIFSRNGIENEAMNLLEALSIWRKRDFDDVVSNVLNVLTNMSNLTRD